MANSATMSFGTWLRAKLAAAWPAGNQKPVTTMPDWPDAFMGWMFNRTLREMGHVNAFYRVPIINAGLRALQTDLCSVPLRVYRGRGDREKPIERADRLVDEGGNLADLLAYANPLDTGRQIMAGLLGSMVLSGDGYWFMEFFRGPQRPPSEIRNMPGHRVRPVPGKNRTEQGFEFQSGGQGPWIPIAGENVIHFRRFNPEDRPTGVADIEAVKETYEAEYFALLWLREFFRNGGVFPGIWTTDETDGVSSRYTDDELKQLARRLQARQTVIDQGGGQTFLPIIIQGLKYVAQGMKLSEMEIANQLTVIDKKILAALGIPPWRLGIQEVGGLGGQGSTSDLSVYWLSTIAGNCSEIEDVINERLAPLFGPDVHVRFDLQAVPAVQQLMLEQAKAHYELTGKKPVESQNEARRAIRLPQDPSEEANSITPLAARPTAFGNPDGPPEPTADPAPAKPAPKGKQAQNRLAAGETDSARGAREELRTKAAFSLATYRGKFEAFVLERLSAQHAVARERLAKAWDGPTGELWNQGGKRVKLALDVSSLMDNPSESDEVRASKLLQQLLQARGISAIQDLEQAANVALEVTLDLGGAAWADFLQGQIDRVIRLPDATTRRAMRDSMSEGLAANENLEQMLARLDAVFEGRRNNALTIARTETQPAYNFAAMEAWKQSGIVNRLQWMTSHSGTGGRHAENPEGKYDNLDGQVRAIGAPFDVGGTPLLYPGDVAGPPGETVHCACTIHPVLDEAQLSARRFAQRLQSNGHVNGNGKAQNRIREFLRGRAA